MILNWISFEIDQTLFHHIQYRFCMFYYSFMQNCSILFKFNIFYLWTVIFNSWHSSITLFFLNHSELVFEACLWSIVLLNYLPSHRWIIDDKGIFERIDRCFNKSIYFLILVILPIPAALKYPQKMICSLPYLPRHEKSGKIFFTLCAVSFFCPNVILRVLFINGFFIQPVHDTIWYKLLRYIHLLFQHFLICHAILYTWFGSD